MKVAVKYMAQLRDAVGLAYEQVELDKPCSVQEFATHLAARHGDRLRRLLLDAHGGLQPTILLFVGGRQVVQDSPVEIHDGDVVTVLSPMAGG